MRRGDQRPGKSDSHLSHKGLSDGSQGEVNNEESMKKHVSITVHGNLIKSGFRFSAIDKALEWNLTGLIKNYENNSVQIEVEGDIDDLQKFLKWCHIGTGDPKPEKIDYTSSEELQNYETFTAEY